MTCEITIRLDRPEARYRGGEPIRGSVQVVARQDVQARAITLQQGWRTTGFGNVDRGEVTTIALAGAEPLAAGARLDLPFALTAPPRPLTYQGAQFGLEHVLVAAIDVPWSSDLRGEVVYQLLPGARPDDLTGRDQQLGVLKPPAGKANGCLLALGLVLLLGLIIALLVMLVTSAVIWLPLLALVGLWLWTRKRALAARLGVVEVDSPPPTFAPGEVLTLGLRCTPRKSFLVQGITMHVTAKEKAVKGGGKSRATRERDLFTHREVVRSAGMLSAGEQLNLRGTFTLPPTEAFSLQMENHSVTWRAELRIDIPWFPDWSQSLTLQVVPKEWVQNLAAAPSNASSGTSVKPPPLPDQPATPPPASATIGLRELLEELQQVAQDSTRRNALLTAASAHRFTLELQVDRITATPAGRELPAAYDDGKSLLGKLAASDHSVEVALPNQGEDQVAPRRGEVWSGEVVPTGWDNLYKRPAGARAASARVLGPAQTANLFLVGPLLGGGRERVRSLG